MHTYTIKLSRCAVSPSTNYGYWERKDGTEGGGLWFENNNGTLELTDYDGAFELPRAVCDELVAAGFKVDGIFYPDQQ